ncbi:MAG TPA: PspA/IM30 family protein [Polyangiaceae bacterium]|nr:PspA/IM30 family protein [Polyangiaceae bacterium]
MGFFQRLATLIKSNLNDLISRSEDPERMLNQIVEDMTTQLGEAKKMVALSIADEKRLEKQTQQELEAAAGWEKRAMLAVKASNDDLAKEALARKKEHESTAEQFKDQWQKQKQSVDQLKLALRALNSKIEEAKRKKNLLIARKKRAEAQKAIQETMGGLRNASAFETFDRMAGKIEQMEAEASAQAELNEEYSGDVLAHKFQQLEQTKGAEEDLLALKRKMGLAPPEPEPPKARVAATAGGAGGGGSELDAAEQEELARALAELEAEEQQTELRMKK